MLLVVGTHANNANTRRPWQDRTQEPEPQPHQGRDGPPNTSAPSTWLLGCRAQPTHTCGRFCRTRANPRHAAARAHACDCVHDEQRARVVLLAVCVHAWLSLGWGLGETRGRRHRTRTRLRPAGSRHMLAHVRRRLTPRSP
jgi:hypothetical protein